MNIYLCGQKYFGWLVYRMLLDMGHSIVGVSAPANNGNEPDRLWKAAIALETPVMIGGALNADNLPDGVDLIICAHSFDFVGAKTLAGTKLGGIGYHPSLLPLHRGRSSVEWAIRMGDKVTGGTVYWLSKTVDGGPIAAQDWCFVPPGATPQTLWRERLQPMGLTLLRKAVNDISNGKIVAIPQEEGVGSWEPSTDSPPVFRPDLPQIGSLPGYSFITRREQTEDDWGAAKTWKELAGG